MTSIYKQSKLRKLANEVGCIKAYDTLAKKWSLAFKQYFSKK